jgi:hypothetical protein
MKRAILLSMLVLFLAGCVDYSEELWLRKDGSGRAKMVIGVLTNYLNEQEINRYMDQPGISLISKSVYRKNKFTYYKLDFRFNSLEAFNNLNDQVSNADFFGRISLKKEKDGTITMRRSIALGSMPSEQDEIEQLIMAHLQKDMKWRYKMHLPWKIVKTNAAPENTDYKTNTVSWEYKTAYLWNQSQTMTVNMKKAFPLLPVILIGMGVLVVLVTLLWWRRGRKPAPAGSSESQPQA